MYIDSLILPIAQRTNCRKRFGNPGKADKAILPSEAASWIRELVKGGKTIKGVNLCGPGDVLAAPDACLSTLDLLQPVEPRLYIKLTTTGLGAASLADVLAEKGVAQVILLVDAVDTEIIQHIYTWIRPGRKTVPLPLAAEMLWNEQQEALCAFKEAGIKVSVQTTVYPGINDEHIGMLAQTMAELGARSITLLPFRPISEEDALPACDDTLLASVEEAAAVHLALEGYAESSLTPPPGRDDAANLPRPTQDRPNVAVVSAGGMEVDIHLGQADRVLIYGPREDGLACLLETRTIPEAGAGDTRWESLAKACLHDCFALLATNAGQNPQRILGEQGIRVFLTQGDIAGTVDVLYGGGRKNKCKQ